MLDPELDKRNAWGIGWHRVQALKEITKSLEDKIHTHTLVYTHTNTTAGLSTSHLLEATVLALVITSYTPAYQ